MSVTSDSVDVVKQSQANKIAAGVIILVAIFWMWFSTTHDLVQDEAYYWQWSRHLAVGYFDNTPVMAWVIDLMTHIFGDTELGVRSGAILCSSVCAWFLFKLAKDLFGDTIALVALGLVYAIPFFGALAFIMTADPTQMGFWAITAYISWHAVNAEPKSGRSWLLWLLSGLFAGLAGMSKVNGMLVLPSVLLFIVLEPSQRKWLANPQPYSAAVVAFLVFSPFIWWNSTHGNAFWLHIHHMSSRGEDGNAIKFFGQYLGGQAGLITPFLFLTYLWAMITSLTWKNLTPQVRYCWAMSVVVFAETGMVALKSRVEANWPVAAYETGVILLAYVIVKAWELRKFRLWHALSVGLAAFLTIFVYVYTLTTHSYYIYTLNKTDELYGWRQVAAIVQNERVAMGDNPFIFGVEYEEPSEMAFYLPDKPQTYELMLHDKGSEYEFWENAQDLVGRDAIMVNSSGSTDHLDDARVVFQKVIAEPPLPIYRPGIKEPIRTIQIFRCYGFKGYKREDWQRGY